MNIHLYTLCWNEIDILPFVIDYWKRLSITKAIVYDNGSTDGSIEFLQQFDWIEVRHFKTEGQNDIVQKDLKNSIWKESKGKCDFVIVCDMDELIYSKDITVELTIMKNNKFAIMGTKWFCMRFDKRPEYTPGKLLHQLGDKFFTQYINHDSKYNYLGKFMLFDPNIIDDMNYVVGAHKCTPVSHTNDIYLYITNNTYTIHIDKGLSEDYFVQRRQKMAKNLSEINKKHNMCFEYMKSEDEIRKEYRQNQLKSVNLPF